MSEPEKRSIELTNLNKWRAIYRTLLVTLTVIIICAQAAALVVLVVRQNVNSGKTDRTLSILAQVKKTNDFITDCTTPGHKCYDDSHKSSSTTIQQLDTVIELTGFCSHIPANDTFPKVRSCVEDGLK